ncbi:terminase small subunit protein [Camelimonas abortus]|uniref:Terminase small subunit protein n=1 Tax=Camelimonas abortus TaxID=1017184 RepID=A0ABV7LEJ4_9HYPH
MTAKYNGAARPGRPTIFTQLLADQICAELATGKSMRTMCRDEAMPSMSTVYKWLRERPDFSQQYVKAKAEAADALAEEILDIADDATGDWLEIHDTDGFAAGYRLNGEHVQRSRLQIDARKWIAARLKPRKYGGRGGSDDSVQSANPPGGLVQDIRGLR